MPPDLLESILAAPDDDLPRLIAADWYEENGEPERAEFIRVQIERNNLLHEPVSTDDRTHLSLETREKILLHKHGERWLAPLRQRGEPLQSRSTHGQFVRGFVEVVWMSATLFLKRGEKLFRRTPLRELKVTRMLADELFQLSHFPICQKLDSLDLSGRDLSFLMPYGERGLGKALTQLKRLTLIGCNLGDFGAEMIRAYPFAAPLERLDLSRNPLSTEARRELSNQFGPAFRFKFD